MPLSVCSSPKTSRFIETAYVDAAFRLETREGNLSPVSESPRKTLSNVVNRSRTLPPSRTRGFSMPVLGSATESNGHSHADKTRVLRKQKRASTSQHPYPDRAGTKNP